MSVEELIVAFIVSTIGFCLYLFGRKQRRIPHYVTGMLMMTFPLVLRDPLWATVTTVAMLAGMKVAIAFGW